MPAHDWTRVDSGIFHHFHLTWIVELQRVFNQAGRDSCYALTELTFPPPEVAGRIASPTDHQSGLEEVVRLDAWPGVFDATVTPPQVHLVMQAESFTYAARQRTLVIREPENHQAIALIEMISPGTKASRYLWRRFLDKALAALCHGIHLLILDLHPPGPRDPNGIHGVLWGELTGQEDYQQPPDLPLTLAAYSAGLVKTAYVEPMAVGMELTPRPLFLEAEVYINVPLEATYMEAYAGVPQFYRDILER